MSPRVTNAAQLPGAFAYEHTDVPPGQTLSAWRRQHGHARRRRITRRLPPSSPAAARALAQRSTTVTTVDRSAQIAALYARHADRLHRLVASRVHAPDATIEDACQNAWAILLRRPHITLDERGIHWLATVAIREGWRRSRAARDVPAGDSSPSLHPCGADGPDAFELTLAHLEHEQRVNDLAQLKPRERRELLLKALGFRYEENASR